jgi:ABC-type sulfate transport system permease component
MSEQGRIYELRPGGWIEIDDQTTPASGWRRLASALVASLAIASVAATIIAAAALAIMLLPLGLLAAWLGKRRAR